MTAKAAPAAAPGSTSDPGASPRRGLPSVLHRAWTLAGVVPFFVYVLLGLGLPAIAIAVGAFQNPDTGKFTLSNISIATHGIYLHGFIITAELSLITSIVPGILGLLIGYAIFTARRGALLRRVTITASGTFANFGGVPLAFLFIATLGTTGIATRWLTDIGFNPYTDGGFNLYDLGGVALVYLYFQIPLMVLIILPAFEGLRPAWREAAQNMGASTWHYWRYIGGPVLMPSFLGCLLLLFGSAFSAYATAEALTSGTIPLTAIQIGSFLNGNVLAGQQNVGKALGLGMVLIIAVLMVFYALLQRRAARWLQ
ncbi:MAG TPA: ABC transporter permease subunit [Streptosporangiaceae bacterium]|nr:ABC transporter permease subunit [Streptosporangiaceae bacterium]